MTPPAEAVRDVADDEFDRYVVVRVADEIVVDLMKAACGIEYEEASRMTDVVTIEGVAISFASPLLLSMTKQIPRDRDRPARAFLAQILGDALP